MLVLVHMCAVKALSSVCSVDTCCTCVSPSTPGFSLDSKYCETRFQDASVSLKAVFRPLHLPSEGQYHLYAVWPGCFMYSDLHHS